MNNLKEYITEKFKLHKGMKSEIYIILIKYLGFHKFKYEICNSIDEALDIIKKYGTWYNVYKVDNIDTDDIDAFVSKIYFATEKELNELGIEECSDKIIELQK